MRAFIENLQHEDHKKALVATLVFIMLMILFFLLVSLEYPNPPIEEKVVEVQIEFGSDFAGGGQQSNVSEVVPQEQPESADEKATQDESPVTVPSSQGTSSTSNNTVTTPTTKPIPTPKPDPKPTVDQGLGFPGGGSSGNGGGTGTGFGDGGGVGEGGDGPSEGSGNYKTTRKIVSEPKVEANSQEEGKVAVDIYVNEFGKVVRVEFNESQTNTGSDYLRKLAKKSAFLIKFDKDPGAPVLKVKTKVYNFRKV
ncbi:MAG: hypothetical protein AB8B72_09080 [Crocinitomicaceae bacterium]